MSKINDNTGLAGPSTPEQDLEQVEGWIRRLAPPGTPGRVWIGSKSTNFRGAHFDPADMQDMLREVRKRDRDPGIFLRMTTIRPEAEKRGTADDSIALFGLWADLDIEGPGHKHDPSKHNGRRLPQTEEQARGLVDHLPEPSAWIRSGGGLYPFWLPRRPWDVTDPDQRQRYAELSAELQASIGSQAEERGLHYGTGVGDLARILRLPGTVNRKVPGELRMCEIEWGGGPLYRYEELRAAVPRPQQPTPRRATVVDLAPVPAVPAPRAPTRLAAPVLPEWDSTGPGPFDDFAARNDLCSLLEQDGWSFAYESQGRRHYARPGKHPKDGISGNVMEENGRQVLYVFSEEAGLPTFRGLSVGEWYAWRHHGGDLSAAGRALRALGYGAAPMASTTRLAALPSPSEAAGVPQAGAALPAVIEAVPEQVRRFWTQRPILEVIRHRARTNGISPWGLLGVYLGHAVARIGPHVLLPPLSGRSEDGGHASLNMWIALVSQSGGGKGTCLRVGRAMLKNSTVRIAELEVGTGQGIDGSYTKQTKQGPVQYNDTVLWVVPEVDTLAAHAEMKGATLLPTMRKLYSGEALGAQYADINRRRPVADLCYRSAVLMGVQRRQSAPLLTPQQTAGGTPQRILWLPTLETTDLKARLAGASGRGIKPPPSWLDLDPDERAAAGYPVRLPGWHDRDEWRAVGKDWADREGEEEAPVPIQPWLEIQVAEPVRLEVWRRVAQAQLNGELGIGDPADGHAAQTQLKIAALLGLLDGRAAVSEEDWQLASSVMWISNMTRQSCRDEITKAARASRTAKAINKAEDTETERDMAARLAAERAARLRARVIKYLAKRPGEWHAQGRLISTALSDVRQEARTVLAEMVESGEIEGEQQSAPGAPGGVTWRYRVVPPE